jgi:hypothetical protein
MQQRLIASHARILDDRSESRAILLMRFRSFRCLTVGGLRPSPFLKDRYLYTRRTKALAVSAEPRLVAAFSGDPAGAEKPVRFRTRQQNQSSVAVLEGGGLIVELIQHDDATSVNSKKPSHLIHGISKVGVIVDDFDGTLATLKSRGVEIFLGPFPARNGQRANVIEKDNSGNLIQLFGKSPPPSR